MPLLTALSFGVASVEADVWLINGTLFVSRSFKFCCTETHLCHKIGHELAALNPNRTLDSVYIQPLLKVLGEQNPQDLFTVNQTTRKSGSSALT